MFQRQSKERLARCMIPVAQLSTTGAVSTCGQTDRETVGGIRLLIRQVNLARDRQVDTFFTNFLLLFYGVLLETVVEKMY